MPTAIDELALRDHRTRRELLDLLHNQRVTTPDGTTVPHDAHIDPHTPLLIDHNPVPLDQPARLFLMHKPRKHICGMTDDQSRPTLTPYLTPDMAGARHIGRLDFNTTGLLLWTNARRFQRLLLDPRSHLPRVYRVKVRDRISPDDHRLPLLASGTIDLDGTPVLPCTVSFETLRTRATWIRITLTEGRFRQIRRMCSAVGFQIVKLERHAIGQLTLPETLTPRCVTPATAEHWQQLLASWHTPEDQPDHPLHTLRTLTPDLAEGRITTRALDALLARLQNTLWTSAGTGERPHTGEDDE